MSTTTATTIPMPTDIPLPAWATSAGEWTAHVEEGEAWFRQVTRPFGAHVELYAFQRVGTDGALIPLHPQVDILVDWTDEPETLRAVGASLVEAAGVLEAAQAVTR